MNGPDTSAEEPFRTRCTEPGCERTLRKTDRANLFDMLCYEHDQHRVAIRSADQRRRRHGTTAPAVTFPSPEAHWLRDAWNDVALAENALLRDPGTDARVRALLAALAKLHAELDAALGTVDAVLKARPSAKPRKGRPPKR